MKISVGYEMAFECERPTPMLLTVNVHPSREADLIVPDRLQCEPAVPVLSTMTTSATGAAASWRPPGAFG